MLSPLPFRADIECETRGFTLETLVMPKGYYRMDRFATDFYQCASVGACTGGAWLSPVLVQCLNLTLKKAHDTILRSS